VGVLPSGPDRRRCPLPLASTPLIGREAELAALASALIEQEARLITLTGPPGVGKTRLAIAVAAAIEPRFSDGVVFVDLTRIRDPNLVLPEVARGLGVGDGPGRPLAERVLAAVADRDLLLVVDNLEHVLGAGPALAAPLTACPRLRLLTTSRERLHLLGEREYSMSPLRLPTPEDVGDLERLCATPAIMMLLHCVRAVLPGFAVTAANAGALAEICLRLDGLPLALELAAARLKLFTPDELTFRLRHRMALLTGGARDGPDRHRTLRAALTWSHGLLGADERALFRRSSVFVGAWTLEAAREVCAVPDVVEAIASLIDKSLVRRRSRHGDVAEFVMLESLREYGAELLAEHGEVETTRSRHTRYYADLAVRTEALIGTGTERASVDGVGAAEGNLRDGFEAATASGRTDLALPLASALGWYCYTRGYVGQGWAIMDRALAAAEAGSDPPPDAALAAAVQIAGVLAFARGELDRAEELLDRCPRLDDPVGDLRRRAIDNAFRGHLARARHDHTGAVAYHDRAGTLFEKLGNQCGVAWSRYDLGLLARSTGDLPAAGEYLGEALDRFRSEGYEWAIGCAAWAAGTVERRRGRVAEAAALLTEALERFETVDDARGLSQCLEGAAGIAGDRGAPGSAAQLLGAAAVLRERLAAPLPDEDRGEHHAIAQRARRALGPEATDVARRSGRSLPLVQALRLAHRVLRDAVAPPTADSLVPAIPLTPREHQVARLVASGRTNRQIGRELSIAEKTTEVHVHHILDKLGARCRSEVAVWVSRRDRPG
jgi:predicted ATPase/DNA-binding CsgD family transcriptional regulator